MVGISAMQMIVVMLVGVAVGVHVGVVVGVGVVVRMGVHQVAMAMHVGVVMGVFVRVAVLVVMIMRRAMAMAVAVVPVHGGCPPGRMERSTSQSPLRTDTLGRARRFVTGSGDASVRVKGFLSRS